MTAGDSPLLEVDDLTFRYRRATEPAIRHVSLAVSGGDVLLVAGPSGCGKSTLIRAINGLIPHAYPGELSGSVRLEGRPTTDLKLRDIARTVGTVLQDPAKQIVGATVEAELAFGPENLGVPAGGDPRPGGRRRRGGRDRVAPRPRDGGPLGRRAPAARDGRNPDDAAAAVRRRRAAGQPGSAQRGPPAGDPPGAGRPRRRGRHRRTSGRGGARAAARPGPLPRRGGHALPGVGRGLPGDRRPGRGEAALRGGPRARSRPAPQASRPSRPTLRR